MCVDKKSSSSALRIEDNETPAAMPALYRLWSTHVMYLSNYQVECYWNELSQKESTRHQSDSPYFNIRVMTEIIK